MAVAKTYEKYEMRGEPFCENKRMYIYVVTPKGEKKVRWYTDAQYAKMYDEAPKSGGLMDFDARHAFGFGPKGYITIYKGDNVENWAKKDLTNLRYNLTFSYYTPSRLELPQLEDGITPIRLSWDEVMDYDTRMKPHDVVRKIVAEKVGSVNKSTYQGQINEWLTKEIIVITKKNNDTSFGTKHTYLLKDNDGNLYSWETGAKDYEISQKVTLKMKVKTHSKLDGNPITVVWYCKEIK